MGVKGLTEGLIIKYQQQHQREDCRKALII